MAKLNTLMQLFEHELRDIYYAEHRLMRALEESSKEAQSEALRRAFRQHLEETKGQIKRLDLVFKEIGKAPRGIRCEGILGLLKERKGFMAHKPDPQIADLDALATGMKLERYEISAYESLTMLAQELDLVKANELLEANLEEEEGALDRLQMLAEDFDFLLLLEQSLIAP